MAEAAFDSFDFFGEGAELCSSVEFGDRPRDQRGETGQDGEGAVQADEARGPVPYRADDRMRNQWCAKDYGEPSQDYVSLGSSFLFVGHHSTSS